MSPSILSTVNLCKHLGRLIATNNVSLEVAQGEVHALIGPNGAGKTTLIAQLQGELAPNSGQVFFCVEKAASAGQVGAGAYVSDQLYHSRILRAGERRASRPDPSGS